MSSILLVSFVSILSQTQPTGAPSQTTDSAIVGSSPGSATQPAIRNTKTVTEPSQLSPTTTRDQDKVIAPNAMPPWEFLIGFQHWGKQGNVGFGFSKGRHEIRLLGPNTGLYLDYKATLLRIKKVRFNAGGLVGVPSVFGGHVGIQYRTGGDSCWGRVAIGIDGGVSCSRDGGSHVCNPAGGINVGLFFAPSDFIVND